MANKSGIYINPANKGKFTETKKRTNKSTGELLHSKNPLTRKRANFARMAKRHWKPLEDGGLVNPFDFGGLLSTIGGVASAIPGVGGLVGAGLGIAGNLISVNKRKKEAEKQMEAQQRAQTQQAMLAMPKSSEGIVPGVTNPYVLALGGYTNKLETYNTGGLHEENPLGGIPLGTNKDGQTDAVEEGEASFKFDDGKYIFSNRLILG